MEPKVDADWALDQPWRGPLVSKVSHPTEFYLEHTPLLASTTTPFDLSMGYDAQSLSSAVSLVFGGCCTNAFSLEILLKDNPSIGK